MDGMGFLSNRFGGVPIGGGVPVNGWDQGPGTRVLPPDTSPTGAWNQPGPQFEPRMPMPSPAPPVGRQPGLPMMPAPAPHQPLAPMPPAPAPAPRQPGPNRGLPINQPRVPAGRRPFNPIVLG